jgi:hypothetical protein
MVRFSRRGYRLFRYFVGVLWTAEGHPVSLGVPGISDLVGWRDYVVRPEDVGRTLAVFTAVEVKHGDNRPSKEQKRFLAAVADAGGEAWVTTDDEDVLHGAEGARHDGAGTGESK